MNKTSVHTSLTIPVSVYEEIKKMAEENEISISRAINSILVGYVKAKKKRERK